MGGYLVMGCPPCFNVSSMKYIGLYVVEKQIFE